MPKDKKEEKKDWTREHLKTLIGGHIIGVEDDGGTQVHDRRYGLRIQLRDGNVFIAWILRDPEGNGPGFLDYEETSEEVPKESRKVGQRVRALVRVTEGGIAGDKTAKFPAPSYIHAEPGDAGVVIDIHNDMPTVRFDKTLTASLVAWSEITLEMST
jgi:hypothetical protein